ncbi:DeoR/GlpR family DNA-binding transcription regulator [Coraliomargarita sp. SDUM461004]|uniref:DeoR/GlpR family DNA-binding transcription regulator n=1 Tax=Thalassobacterium sedimentorum TaxID=3041258 RepID=A0ABU1AIA5_9BACT|nr:DeoR/GlpR family DNA-binding transcription regulator [Coraliomargarita sp. SDUM461004]MDQ8194552.1 DeoR/GlpR family DNA-binding transcription regulator [Coraliomargarita sp. SDUM461004]
MNNPRHQRILSLLSAEVECKSATLMHELGVSEATLRRDLSELVERGKVVRTHGGALLRPEALHEASFIEKTLSAPEGKRAIAACALDLISSNTSVYIDSGTTCLELARRLLRRNDCHIFTNSIPIVVEACNYNANVTVIGGSLRAVSRALIGSTPLNWLENLHFDYSIIGASAIDTYRGAFTTETHEASIKQQAMRASENAILLCDHSKWEKRAPVRFAQWSDFDHCIIDEDLEAATARTLGKQLHLHLAQKL